MRLSYLMVLVGITCSSCGEMSEAPPSLEANSPSEVTDFFVREYREKHKEHLVPKGSVPRTNLVTVKNIWSSPIWNRGQITLSLNLGRRTPLGEGRFRTTSRYRIYSEVGDVNSEAESILATEDRETSDLSPSVQVAFDEHTKNLFVLERHSWSAERMLIMSSEGAGVMVRYIRIPQRRSLEPFQHYQVLAFHNGRVYFELDGEFFGFPLDALISETELTYTIG